MQAFSQRVAIKNNLVYGTLLAPNLSQEFSLGEEWALDTSVGMNFFYENTPITDGYKTRKWGHCLVQPEIRYWESIYDGSFSNGSTGVNNLIFAVAQARSDAHAGRYQLNSTGDSAGWVAALQYERYLQALYDLLRMSGHRSGYNR